MTVEVSGADWSISGKWHRASKIDQVNPLSDRELEANRQAARATD